MLSILSKMQKLIPLSSSKLSNQLHSVWHYKFSSTIATVESRFLSANTQVNNILNPFLKDENVTTRDIIMIMDKLEQNKCGIAINGDEFKKFLSKADNLMRQGVNLQELTLITQKAHNLNIKDHLFWFALDNIIRSTDHQGNLGALLPLYSLMIRNKAYVPFEFYFHNISNELKKALSRTITNLNLHQLIHVNYLYAYISVPYTEILNSLKSNINRPRAVLKTQLSPNDISSASMILTSQIDQKDKQLPNLVNELGGAFLEREVGEYDVNIEKLYPEYYVQGKYHNIKERLTWESLSYMASVYSKNIYNNPQLLKRVQELIRKKYETDLIDFESASLTMTSFLQSKCDIDLSTYQMILDMVSWQMINEGPSILNQFDGRNIIYFLQCLRDLDKLSFNHGILQDFYDYFSGVLMSRRIASRILPNDYDIILKIYEATKTQFQHPQDIFAFLKNASQEKPKKF